MTRDVWIMQMTLLGFICDAEIDSDNEWRWSFDNESIEIYERHSKGTADLADNGNTFLPYEDALTHLIKYMENGLHEKRRNNHGSYLNRICTCSR